MLLRDMYADEIHQFFQGQLFFPRTRGHVWVARHGNFDTLTVEPPEGGQYEIAVRIPFPDGFFEKDKDDSRYPDYQGYIASDGYLSGVNTGGH